MLFPEAFVNSAIKMIWPYPILSDLNFAISSADILNLSSIILIIFGSPFLASSAWAFGAEAGGVAGSTGDVVEGASLTTGSAAGAESWA